LQTKGGTIKAYDKEPASTKNEKRKQTRMWELTSALDGKVVLRTRLSRADESHPAGNDNKANAEEQDTKATSCDDETKLEYKERSRLRRPVKNS